MLLNKKPNWIIFVEHDETPRSGLTSYIVIEDNKRIPIDSIHTLKNRLMIHKPTVIAGNNHSHRILNIHQIKNELMKYVTGLYVSN